MIFLIISLILMKEIKLSSSLRLQSVLFTSESIDVCFQVFFPFLINEMFKQIFCNDGFMNKWLIVRANIKDVLKSCCGLRPSKWKI